MKIKRYEAKDELLRLIDEDPELKGWEGSTKAHLRYVRYPERMAKGKARASEPMKS